VVESLVSRGGGAGKSDICERREMEEREVTLLIRVASEWDVGGMRLGRDVELPRLVSRSDWRVRCELSMVWK